MRNFGPPLKEKENGLVVQLVRIRACHARGRGFESRPDRLIQISQPTRFLQNIVYMAVDLETPRS